MSERALLLVGRFRKRPVVIEAMHYTVESCKAIHDWLGYEHADHALDCHMGIFIDTLEGEMRASVGDWIVKGVQGEFYAVKPDIFEQTYEAVDD